MRCVVLYCSEMQMILSSIYAYFLDRTIIDGRVFFQVESTAKAVMAAMAAMQPGSSSRTVKDPEGKPVQQALLLFRLQGDQCSLFNGCAPEVECEQTLQILDVAP